METTPNAKVVYGLRLWSSFFALQRAIDAARSDNVREVSSTEGDEVFAGTLLRKIVSSYSQARDDTNIGS